MTNSGSDSVSIINTIRDNVVDTVNVGSRPIGVAANPSGTKLYVTNTGESTVSVIDTTTKMVVTTVLVGSNPVGIAVTPDGSKVYVSNVGSNSVSVINTSALPMHTKFILRRQSTANIVSATIPVGNFPVGVAVTPDGSKVYVTNFNNYGNVFVINTSTNIIIANVAVGQYPTGIAVSPDGRKVYVANGANNNVSVITTSTNNVTATVNVEHDPLAWGQFITNPSLHNWILRYSFIFLVCIILSVLSMVSLFIAAIIFRKLSRKKSFEQIRNELQLKSTSKEKLSIISYIHFYLQKNTLEELLLFNLKFNGNRYFSYYYYDYVAYFAIIFLFTSLFIFVTDGYVTKGYVFYLLCIFLLAPILLPLVPMFILGWINRKAGIEKISWNKYIIRFFTNIIENSVQILFPIVISIILLIILFTSDKEWIVNFFSTGFLKNLLTFFPNLLQFDINSRAKSNQLSLAGFYFSLAVGGTVILSIVDRYYKEERLLKTDLLEQIEMFNETYSESLSLNLSCIVNKDFIKNFANILSQIQTKLKSKEIETRIKKIQLYQYCVYLAIVTYLLGIITIFVNENFATILL